MAPVSVAGERAVLNMITAVMKAEMMRPANVLLTSLLFVGKLGYGCEVEQQHPLQC